MISSVYIHIPFCKSICSYCDFCKLFYNEKLVDDYLDALEVEIKEKYKNDIIKTLYIGGGSPSSLNLKQLNRLFEIIKIFNLDKDCEFTIEMNVLDIVEDKLLLLKENNVNRISIGIETVNEKYMDFLERHNKKQEVINIYKLTKKYFDNINLDLMYAFPNETIDEVIGDLDFVIGLSPKHISIYSLIIEEHTKLYISGVVPIDEEIESEMYYNIIKRLNDNGYRHYEISNFAKEGYESQHNLVYWNNEKYYGFGLGASGYIDNYRYTNTRNIRKYISLVFDSEKDNITKQIDMENELILGLRKVDGISKTKFKDKYALNVEDSFDIISLINKKLLEFDGDFIRIPKDKLYVSNSILVNFIGGSSND